MILHSRVRHDLREGTHREMPLVIMKRTVLGKRDDFGPDPGRQEDDPRSMSSGPQVLGHSLTLHLEVCGPAPRTLSQSILWRRNKHSHPTPLWLLESCLLPTQASTCIHLHQGRSSHHTISEERVRTGERGRGGGMLGRNASGSQIRKQQRDLLCLTQCPTSNP